MKNANWPLHLLALVACLVIAGCSAASHQPVRADQTGDVQRGSDSGGGSM